MRKQHIRESRGDRLFSAFNALFLLAVVLIILCPVIYIIMASLSDPMEVIKGRVVFWPKGFTLKAYENILQYKNVLNSYKNTIVYTVLGTTINIVMTVLCAYPLSRRTLKGRGVITFLITVTMLFGGGMIPTYLVVKSLGMVNTMWALLIPGAIGTWNMFIMKNYFQSSIPGEIMEAAYIDGASEGVILTKIVLPLSMPILAVMLINYASGHWNSYFAAKIYIRDFELYPLQLVINNLLSAADMDGNSMGGGGPETSSLINLRLMLETMKFAACVISTVPIMLIFPLVQRYFEKGVMLGAIKG